MCICVQIMKTYISKASSMPLQSLKEEWLYLEGGVLL